VSRYCTQITWDDSPHLSAEDKARLYDSIPLPQRDARTKGVPILGAGKIYPVAEELLLVDPFPLPEWWPKAYGFDADWNHTAAIWGAWDRESDTVYLYSEYSAGQQPPAVHADAVRRRGEYLIGAMDPSTAGKISPKDGARLSEEYRDLGLNLVPADNAVEAGLFACYQRMAAGRLKVFSSLRSFLTEFRIYRRDEHGRVVKERDHLCDSLRYLIMTGLGYAGTAPESEEEKKASIMPGRSAVTGY
jgi:hypothetical protein